MSRRKGVIRKTPKPVGTPRNPFVSAMMTTFRTRTPESKSVKQCRRLRSENIKNTLRSKPTSYYVKRLFISLHNKMSCYAELEIEHLGLLL